MARECPRCGTDNPSAARFCRRCGGEMQARIATPPPVPPPVRRRGGFPLFRLLLIVAIVLFWVSMLRSHRRPQRPHYFHAPVEVCPTTPAPARPFRYP